MICPKAAPARLDPLLYERLRQQILRLEVLIVWHYVES